MKKIRCPHCGVTYLVEKYEQDFVKCIDCKCSYLQEQADVECSMDKFIICNKTLKN